VTKQFLSRLQIDPGRTKVGRKRMAEAVPADDFLRNAALSSAGRITFFNTMSGVTGFFPCGRHEANTKSLSPGYGVSSLQAARVFASELANRAVLDAIAAGQDPQRIAEGWRPPLDAFDKQREKALIYPP